MKKLFAILLFTFVVSMAGAQVTAATDTTVAMGKINVYKDNRLDVLAKKEGEINEANAASSRSGKGYRLMLLSTNDRPMAMNVRAQLLQHFPDQKIYMSFQPPYIKLKFGNFTEKEEAEKFKKEIIKTKLVSGTIYIVPETIEIKPDKNKDKEKEVQ